ncbi:MAG: acylphosphatase [Bacteroidota bacterium]
MPAYSIRVIGKVQGVFFRVSMQKKAQQLGVRGWVRNEADGSVLIHAEGSEESLQSLIAWCHRGSIHADVQQVDVKGAYKEGFADFQVRR